MYTIYRSHQRLQSERFASLTCLRYKVPCLLRTPYLSMNRLLQACPCGARLSVRRYRQAGEASCTVATQRSSSSRLFWHFVQATTVPMIFYVSWDISRALSTRIVSSVFLKSINLLVLTGLRTNQELILQNPDRCQYLEKRIVFSNYYLDLADECRPPIKMFLELRLDILEQWPEGDYENPSEKRRPAMYIVAGVFASIATATVAARVYSRLWIRRYFGPDDALIVIAC